ncbi:MAG: homocysteine S-methyltransferase family protein [Planctomycetota bacterium]|nr:homocysteine S-methyltransferase family protein [Planctomycetota bacterium]
MGRSLAEALRERALLSDGAMGTQLQAAGLEPGGCGEAWNLEHPDRLLAIQKAYVDAGSDCLITNTFGASRIMLERHGRGDEAAAINRAGVEIARQAFGDKPGFVLGDVGPFGGLMEPYGDVPEKRVREAFAEQAEALVAAGADAVIVETQTALEELGIGIEAARRAGAPCVIGSLAYDVTFDGTEARTMMGVAPEQAAGFLRDAGADVVALNCGSGIDLDWAARIVERYRAVCDLPTMAQPNAGAPVLEKGVVLYKQTPEEMAAGVPGLLAAGTNIVGGCCGSTPEHIRLFRKALDDRQGERS